MIEKKKTILLVDDHEIFLQAMISNIESPDYEIKTLNDGYYLFEAIEKEKPDLIVLDMQMPKLDGVKTCRTLKNSEEYKDIPIIISTGTEDSVEEQKVKMFGAAEYVVKPYDYNKFKKVIRKYLGLDIKEI